MCGEFDLTIPDTLQEAPKSLVAGGKGAGLCRADGVQYRDRGGNIVCGSPAADLVLPLPALEGEVTLTGPNGSRTVALGDCYTG